MIAIHLTTSHSTQGISILSSYLFKIITILNMLKYLYSRLELGSFLLTSLPFWTQDGKDCLSPACPSACLGSGNLLEKAARVQAPNWFQLVALFSSVQKEELNRTCCARIILLNSKRRASQEAFAKRCTDFPRSTCTSFGNVTVAFWSLNVSQNQICTLRKVRPSVCISLCTC